MSFETYFGSDKFNLYQTITPFKGSKKGLLIYRIIVLIILFFGFIGSFYCSYTNPRGFMWLSYFTNQTFVAIMVYFTLGIIFYYREKNGKLKAKACNSFIHTIAHIFYNILLPLAFIVTVIYWGLILPFLNTSYFTWINWATNVIQHLLQSIVVCIDWFLISIPTNYHHYLPMVVVGVVYLIFAQIYHIIYNVWIYSFLDTSKNKRWYITYISVIIAWIILGFVFVAIQKFKNRNRKFVSEDEKSEKKKENIEMV